MTKVVRIQYVVKARNIENAWKDFKNGLYDAAELLVIMANAIDELHRVIDQHLDVEESEEVAVNERENAANETFVPVIRGQFTCASVMN